MAADDPLLSVRDLSVSFTTDDGVVRAVDSVTFDVHAKETVGVVGESGSGKSVSSLAILGLLPKTAEINGEIRFRGRDLRTLAEPEMEKIRGKEIAMIFQDPMTSLNPVLTIGRQIREVLETHFGMDRAPAEHRAAELIDRVGIPSAKARLKDYPHQFSGGMRQRAMIAMALACQPKLLIADEPTTALDVTIQAQILDLLRELVAHRTRQIAHPVDVVNHQNDARLVGSLRVDHPRIERRPVLQLDVDPLAVARRFLQLARRVLGRARRNARVPRHVDRRRLLRQQRR